MPVRHWFPKLLTTAAAKKLADLELILHDLEHVVACCDLMLGVGHHPLYDTRSRAFLDSLVVRYRRCFNEGVRQSLSISDFSSLDAEQIKLHDFFYCLGNRHIAHSVNGFEMSGIKVYIDIDDLGNLTRGGLGKHVSNTLGLSLELNEIVNFKQLVTFLIEEVGREKVRTEETVKHELSLMTDRDIRQLPDGFPPHHHGAKVKKQRTWPKKK